MSALDATNLDTVKCVGVVKRAHYSIVAHPIMMGMMIGCWATPVMTAPRLLFAVLNTLYMVSQYVSRECVGATGESLVLSFHYRCQVSLTRGGLHDSRCMP